MPLQPDPAGSAGGLNAFWTMMLQQLRRSAQTDQSIIAGRSQTNTVDQFGNTKIVIGQLNQQVTIGAAFLQPGVQVTTGITTGQGQAVQQNLVTTTATTTAGTNTATVGSALGLLNGMVIGAADVSDPSSGTATPAIVPGSTISNIVGTTLTLTPPAGYAHAVAESGIGIYCAACTWKQETSF